MGYFWDKGCKVYYFRVKKNGKKMYNFNGPVEFVNSTAELHMVDDQPISASHDASQVDTDMHDTGHGDDQGSGIGVEYGNRSSIITMLQNMQVKQDELYKEDYHRRSALLRQLKRNDFVFFKST
ncbi:unnamed protein product [Vicia faba]|uniref:Uncharacterized protein n=1 Tax=Vicia faba TaxID=3906 RepID=A0AAV0YDL4_VICFA|nr:unnamed protein product [Vicia faba]